MNKFTKLCVFCGFSFGVGDHYKQNAIMLGKQLADQKIELVYGGGNVGLMGEIARTVLEHNGRVTGVIPKKIYENVKHIDLNNLFIVENMHERKAKMYELADGFIALPGGMGTLEELAEVITWYQIGYHAKPIGILNVNGFYDGLHNLFSHMIQEGFLKPEYIQNVILDSDPKSLIEKMQQQEMKAIDKWTI